MHLNNKHYILTTNQAGIWAVELPNSGISFNGCDFDHDNQAIDHKHNIAMLNKTNTKSNPKTAGTVIDVLMIYDQAIAERYPGNLLQTRVDQYFNVSNQTYANSDIDLTIRQVGLVQVGYDFDDANFNARNTIQQVLKTGIGVQGFENLPQIRNETGADLVIFLRTNSIENRGNCGIAYFPVSSGRNSFDASYGVNIMADGMSSWSVCTDQVMVHEIGHNLGAGHHNTTVQQRFIPDAAGFAKLGQFGTVMGSFGTGRIDRFLELDYLSNPNIQCGGGPCGVQGQRNNANVIRQLMGPVSNYRNNTSNAPNLEDFSVALTDQDGDEVLDRDDKFPFDHTETTDTDGDGVGNVSDAFPNSADEQLDFDGDGIGNNADSDDDNDGTLDVDDDFPFDNSEFKDSDRDGIGDTTDDFVFEASEFKDYDGDGIGNNADEDDDNDGVTDLSPNKQDLLVINVGNNRILRFDAQTGLAKGIEVLPTDGLLTFQSDLTVNNETQQLYYSTQSSIKKLDLMKPNAEPILAIPAYSNNQNSLSTGFPTAIQYFGNNNLYVGKLNAGAITNYSTLNPTRPNMTFDVNLPVIIDENIIDFQVHEGELFTLGQNIRIYRGNPNTRNMQQIGVRSPNWLVDPYAFVVTGDEILLHTDQRTNQIFMTHAQKGTNEGLFADLSALGYSNPTGIELTSDGRVLIAVSDQNTILEFNLETQEFLGELVSGFGLDQPHKMILVSQLQDRFHQDAEKVIRPNAGGWFNPATSGRGFNVGIFGNRLQMLWFTYDEQDIPIWYSSSGLLTGLSYQGDLLKTKLNSEGEVSFQIIGQLELDFINEREATVNWQMGDASGDESIMWIQSSGEPETVDYTGLWSRPDTPGWGLAVNTNGDISFSILFIYDEEGEPRWSISDLHTGTAPLVFNMSTVFGEGLCPTCNGPISTTSVPSGTTILNLSNESSWSSAINWADPIPGTWQLDETEIVRISSEPTRPR